MKVGNIELNEGGLGGWTLCSIPANKLPQRLATALVKVNEDQFGASFLPIRVVGKQIVNGINYMVLCKEVRATANKNTRIVLLVINIPAGDYTGDKATIVESIDHAELPAEVQDCFDEAIGSLRGVNYVPLLYVGKQVVTGMNYYILCEATVLYPNAVPYPALVCVNSFQDVNTVVSIEKVSALDDIVSGPDKETVNEPLGEWP